MRVFAFSVIMSVCFSGVGIEKTRVLEVRWVICFLGGSVSNIRTGFNGLGLAVIGES